MKQVAITIALALGVLALGLFGCQTSKTTPDNALVLLNVKNHYYISPPCIEAGAMTPPLADEKIAFGKLMGWDSLLTQVRVARAAGYKPDPACRDANGFVQDQSLAMSLLGNGPLGKGDRWNSDGSWNW